MAEWNRFGEEKKYKHAADTNVNPKHVGESLRQLSMEDRLELRRQARERAKRTLHAEVDDDDEEAKAAEEALDRAFKKPKIEGTVVLDTEVDLTCEGKEVDALDPPSSTNSARDPAGEPRGREPDITVVGEDDAADAAPPSRARVPGGAPAEAAGGGAERRQPPLARTSSADQHPPLRRTSSQRSASVVEDLDSTVLDLDDGSAVPQNSPAPSDSSAVASRRARRRASAAKAAAAPGPGPQAGSAAAAPAAKARPAASADASRAAPRCIQLVE